MADELRFACGTSAFHFHALLWSGSVSSNAADTALVQKLEEELQYEKEAAAEELPDFVKAFQAQGVWTVSPRSLS